MPFRLLVFIVIVGLALTAIVKIVQAARLKRQNEQLKLDNAHLGNAVLTADDPYEALKAPPTRVTRGIHRIPRSEEL